MKKEENEDEEDGEEGQEEESFCKGKSQRCLTHNLLIQVRIFSFGLANKSTCSDPTDFSRASNTEVVTLFAWFTHFFTVCRSTSEYIEWRSAAQDNVTVPQPGTK